MIFFGCMKLCPSCDFENGDDAVLCGRCGSDIATVSACVRPPAAPSAIPAVGGAPPSLVRCGRCGEENPSFQMLCSGCGGKLGERADAGNGASGASGGGEASKLCLVVGNKRWECKSGDRLGREGSVGSEAFAGIDTVSRSHLSLSRGEGGGWMVTPLSANKTWLSGKELQRGVAAPLLAGKNEVRLSTRCVVVLEVG